MNGIRGGFMIRVTVCTFVGLFLILGQNQEVRAADSCVTCHTDEELLTKSLGKEDKGKSSLQAGPG